MFPITTLFLVALVVQLPPASLFPIKGSNVEQMAAVANGVELNVQDEPYPQNVETVPNLRPRDLTNMFSFARTMAPSQSFQLDNLLASTDQNSYYRILITFFDLLATCTKMTRDKLIQWRLNESKDQNEIGFLKKLQEEPPSRIVFPDQLPGSRPQQNTLWTTGKRLPYYVPPLDAHHVIDIRR